MSSPMHKILHLIKKFIGIELLYFVFILREEMYFLSVTGVLMSKDIATFALIVILDFIVFYFIRFLVCMQYHHLNDTGFKMALFFDKFKENPMFKTAAMIKLVIFAVILFLSAAVDIGKDFLMGIIVIPFSFGLSMVPPILVFFKKVFDLCLGLFLMGVIMMKTIEYKAVASNLFTKLFANKNFSEETKSLINFSENSENNAKKNSRKMPSLNYPLPLKCYFWKTSQVIVADTINCVTCCPTFEAIPEMKNDEKFKHLNWMVLTYIDKRTFDILKHYLVTKTQEQFIVNQQIENLTPNSSFPYFAPQQNAETHY